MGRPSGSLTRGGRAELILKALDAAPLSRRRIIQATQLAPRPLGIALWRLIKQGRVIVDANGLHFAASSPPLPPAEPAPVESAPSGAAQDAPPLACDPLRPLLGAIIRRAHGLRLSGEGDEAARLLRQAAASYGLYGLPHIRTDLLGLADLFAAHRQTFADSERRRAAA